MNDKLISTEEARQILPIPTHTLRRLLRDGDIPAVRVRNTWLIYEDGLREYIERNTNTPLKEVAA